MFKSTSSSKSYDPKRMYPANSRKTNFEKNIKIEIIGKFSSIATNPLVREYCEGRRMGEEFIDQFKLQYSKNATVNDWDFVDRLVAPVHDPSGRLISIEGRLIHRNTIQDEERKVLYAKGGSVDTLFHFSDLDFDQPLILVEGIPDMAPVWNKFSKNVTTTFGIKITNRQIELLRKFPEIILFPDGDLGGVEFVENLYKHIPGFKVAWIEGKDPNEASYQQIEKALDQAMSSRLFMYKWQKHEAQKTKPKLNEMTW